MIRQGVPVRLTANTLLCLILSACVLEPLAEESRVGNQSPSPESLIEISLTHRLGRSLAIDVDSRHTYENWLVLSGSINEDDGSDFDFSRSTYQSAIDSGAFENRYMGLLEGAGGPEEYRLIELSFGSTDTPVEQWIVKYSMPPELFGEFSGSESLQWQ